MKKSLTVDECKKILSRLGFKLGVSPRLIGARLLSDLDKVAMMEGDLPISSLECAIGLWKACGYPDYAHGKTEPMENPPT